MNKPMTIKERCAAGTSLRRLVVGPIAAAFLVAGCGTPGKVRDINLKGMYVNGYTETLAIGQGKLTSIPGEREALAAHYEEDVAWLSPNKKTHALDLFLVGSNTVAKADKIIGSICTAFSEVAPTISSNNTAAATSPTGFDMLGTASKSNAEVELAKVAAAQAAATAKAAVTNAAAQAACELKTE